MENDRVQSSVFRRHNGRWQSQFGSLAQGTHGQANSERDSKGRWRWSSSRMMPWQGTEKSGGSSRWARVCSSGWRSMPPVKRLNGSFMNIQAPDCVNHLIAIWLLLRRLPSSCSTTIASTPPGWLNTWRNDRGSNPYGSARVLNLLKTIGLGSEQM